MDTEVQTDWTFEVNFGQKPLKYAFSSDVAAAGDATPDGHRNDCIRDSFFFTQKKHGAELAAAYTRAADDEQLAGEWAFGDNVQLARYLSTLGAEVESLSLEHFASDGDKLAKFTMLQTRSPESLLARAKLLRTYSSDLKAVISLVSPVGGGGKEPEGLREMRMLMLTQDKLPLIKATLMALRGSGEQPGISIDRTKSRWSGPDPSGERSIFSQIYAALGAHAHRPGIFRGGDQWWTVNLLNEHAQDAGGVFRETVADISNDLCSTRTPLFIRTPNNVTETGDLRDAWMPNPACEQLDKFEFVGRLMAAAIQSDENIVVNWPPFVWKKVCMQSPSAEDYSKGIDASLGCYDTMLTDDFADPEMFDDCFPDMPFMASYSPSRSPSPPPPSLPAPFVARLAPPRPVPSLRACCSAEWPPITASAPHMHTHLPVA